MERIAMLHTNYLLNVFASSVFLIAKFFSVVAAKFNAPEATFDVDSTRPPAPAATEPKSFPRPLNNAGPIKYSIKPPKTIPTNSTGCDNNCFQPSVKKFELAAFDAPTLWPVRTLSLTEDPSGRLDSEFKTELGTPNSGPN